MGDFLALLSKYTDIINLIIPCIGFPSIGLLIAWIVRRWWIKRQPSDVKVFEIIEDPNELLTQLYNPKDKSAIADQNIPYQSRNTDLTIELDLTIKPHSTRPYLLITGRTGLGKTREAARLSQSLMTEGYSVLYILPGWLDIPTELPRGLISNQGKILVLLDDLNRLFRFGKVIKHPRSAEEPLLAQNSFHDRLLKLLDYLEAFYPNNVRVIATARDEGSEWEVLDFDPNDSLWMRFERYRLPEPSESATINLLENVAKLANVQVEATDIQLIAKTNQGGYRNLIQNIRRLKASNGTLSISTFIPTQYGSWSETYLKATQEHHSISYIFDAIELLRQSGLKLFKPLIEQVALFIWGGNMIQNYLHLRAIRQGLNYLINEIQILPQQGEYISPYDGQIEAKESQQDWVTNLPKLALLVLEKFSSYGEYFGESILMFTQVLFFNGLISEAQKIQLELIRLYPSNPIIILGLGVSAQLLQQYEKSEMLYKQVIELESRLAPEAFHNLAVMFREQGKVKEAEEAFRKSIEINPAFILSYYHLGVLLEEHKRTQEAEDLYRQAFEKNSSFYQAYFSLGILLGRQGRLSESEEVFRHLIDEVPNNPLAYGALGRVLDSQNRLGDAEKVYRSAIQKDENYPQAYYDLAVVLGKQGKLNEAETAFRKLIELAPNFHQAHLGLAIALEGQSRIEEAEREFREEIRLNPFNASSYFKLGVLLDKRDQEQEAELMYRKLIEYAPDDIDFLMQTSISLIMLGRVNQAEDIIKRAIHSHPKMANLYGNLGTIYVAQKRFNEAEEAFQKAKDLDPNQSFFSEGQELVISEKQRDEDSLRENIEKNPEDPQAYYNLGTFLSNLDQNKEAEELFHTSIRKDPNFGKAYLELANLLFKQGQIKDATNAYLIAIEKNLDNVQAHHNLGVMLEKQGLVKEAEKAFRQAILKDPNSANAYFNLAVVLTKQNRIRHAEKSYRTAISLDPKFAPAWWGLGTLLQRQKRIVEAEENYKQAIRVDHLFSEAYGSLGDLLYSQNRLSETKLVFQELININPTNEQGYFGLGSINFDEGNLTIAEGLIRRAIELNGNNPSTRHCLGNLLAKQYRLNEAENVIRELIGINPNNSQAYSELGNILLDLGRTSESHDAYKKAVELDPNNAQAHYNLGVSFFDKVQYEAAEASFKLAIKKDKQFADAFHALGSLLQRQHKWKEANSYLKRAYELEPGFIFASDIAKNYLGLEMQDRYEKHLSEARAFIAPENWHDLACLEINIGNYDLAFEYLKKGLAEGKINAGTAWGDYYFRIISEDTRFIELFGQKPI